MLVSVSAIYGLPLSAAFCGLTVAALDFRRHDGVHRVPKSPQVTQPAMLLQRRDNVCGVDMKLCPASLGGNCCPEAYACGTNSCYSTASSTSVPPEPSLAYSCPTSQRLCPSSVGYGCCPDGMGCGVSRCYSTQPITETIATAITSTASGIITTITTTAIIVRSPSIPTGYGALDGETNGDDNSQTAGTSPSSVPKYMPPSASTDDSDNQDSSLSTTQLGGIIGGAAAFLALAVAAACVLIRHIDKLAGQMSRKSSSSNSRSRTKQSSVSDFDSRDSREDSVRESLRRSQARRKARCSRSAARRDRRRRYGIDATTAGIALETLAHVSNNRSATVPAPGHGDVASATRVNNVSPRILSSPSPLSDSSSTELEASSLAQELAGISSAASLAADLHIHYPQDIPPTDLPRVAVRPPLAYQWMRSIGLLRQSENASPEHFSIDDEEWHGFYGSRDHMAGRTGLGIYYPEVRGGRIGQTHAAGAGRNNRQQQYRSN
ncbi:hypothetical protein TARUN_104 [Trichoderma arundinaceum]|uniref:Uncharacterized protein n=1 Tax=Trichoderma arundinaceum TaxID=490622 RepID=A0A395P1D2_TRIAR|nr:hypothetical protein TARUN_104 [Trichoderma arundinaceum]